MLGGWGRARSAEEPFVDVSLATDASVCLERAAFALKKSAPSPRERGEMKIALEEGAGRLRCRSCGHDDLTRVLDLDRLPLANALLLTKELHEPEDRFPLELFFCPQCALVQIGETVPPDRLFYDYAYASSFSDTVVEHARLLIEALIGAAVSGQRASLSRSQATTATCCNSTRRAASPCSASSQRQTSLHSRPLRASPTLTEFFDEELAHCLAPQGRRADVIHAHDVFAHVPDPNRFVAGIAALLERSGVAIIEAPYVRDLIDKLEFDTIYHEHFSYYSVSAATGLCARHGLVIADVEHVPIHGGSLRYAGEPASQGSLTFCLGGKIRRAAGVRLLPRFRPRGRCAEGRIAFAAMAAEGRETEHRRTGPSDLRIMD